MDKTLATEQANAFLAEHGLTAQDLTRSEYRDLIAEIIERAGNDLVFGGFYGNPELIENIKFRKILNSKGI